jgi:hypothetical protein
MKETGRDGRDGKRREEMGRDRKRWEEMGRDREQQEKMKRDGKRREETGRALAKGTHEEYSRKSGSLPHDVIQHRKPTAVQQFPWR